MSIRLTSVFCSGSLIRYCVFTEKGPVVAIINQCDTTSRKGQSQSPIIDLFIFYHPKLRSVMWGEVGPETFCLVVLGVDALLHLSLQFPIRWGRLKTFSQPQQIAKILSQWIGPICKQRCNSLIVSTFRKVHFSMFNNNSCEKKQSSLVYRLFKCAGYLPQRSV